MKKILLAILIITTGLKMMSDSSAYIYKYSIVKFATQDEESKKEKEENKLKRYNEDICYNNILETPLINATAMLPSSINNQNPYFGFTDKPNTPPPDPI